MDRSMKRKRNAMSYAGDGDVLGNIDPICDIKRMGQKGLELSGGIIWFGILEMIGTTHSLKIYKNRYKPLS